MRWIRLAAAATIVLGACTEASPDRPEPSGSGPSASRSVAPTAATLADGTPLPPGCTGGGAESQTVAFVADGRAWAIDPSDGAVACLFPVEDAGPFAWGPQGDRVILDGFEIRGVSGDAPDLPAIDARFNAFDWGHPLGLAVVFADDRGIPRKRFVDDGRVIRLTSLPPGRYQEVAYHPSGLALGFVVEGEDGQEIWLSTNEGEDPQRLVFSEIGTEFTSIAFTPNGRTLWWTAEHEEGYPELHWMHLNDRSGFGTGWRGSPGTVADGLRLAPQGLLKAVTEGTACGERRALILRRGATTVAMPDEALPTEALGWLDRTTLLVAVGGCGVPLDLYAVDGLGEGPPIPLVAGVELAATRTRVTNPPNEVPEPPAEEGPPPSGVG